MEKLNVYIEDIFVGELYYNRALSEFSFKRYGYGEKTDRVVNELLLNRGSDLIKVALSERYVSPDRVNIDEILAMLGLQEYDLWEIIKRTKGVVVSDPIWFSEENEDGTWFWEKHPLGILVKSGEYQKIMKKQLNTPMYRKMQDGTLWD